ncbi:MAG TPA: S8 family serine peptidase [Terriglobales bacterium]|nr:S8 family serine peptidase [Terriglobales bacterium]
MPQASAQTANYGVLVHLNAATVASFDIRHNVASRQLNPNRDLYLITASDGRTDAALLAEVLTDPAAGRPELNEPMNLDGTPTGSNLDGQSSASVLNGQSSASVLNGGSSPTSSTTTSTPLLGGLLSPVTSLLAPVLNPVGSLLGGILNPLLGSVLNINIGISGGGVTVTSSNGSVLNSAPTNFYGAVVPSNYPNQAVVSQIQAGASTHSLATGSGAVVALIDNGVDPSNPVLTPVLLAGKGYNFYDNTPNWTAYADLALGPGGTSGLDGQSSASVLNGQSSASVLNGGTCAAEFGTGGTLAGGQSSASVLNGGQSSASVLNSATTTAQAVAALQAILACDPDFGHGTSVAGLIHLVAPRAMILPIKAFGPGGTASAATIYQSITYAIDQHVNVMNLSFSALATTPDVQDAIAEAVRDGIVVVAAAGNSDSAAAVFPASLPGVTGVGAADGTQSRLPIASFSNFDSGAGSFVDVDVSAPGVQLFTTYPGAGQIWATSDGTSFSTPLVAGEAALLAQLNQSGDAARSLIERSANPAIEGDANGALGHGLVNVYGAVKAAAPRLFGLWW